MADRQSSDDTQFTAYEHSGFEADMKMGFPDVGQAETAFAQAEFNTRMPRSVERGVMGHCTTTFDHICSCADITQRQLFAISQLYASGNHVWGFVHKFGSSRQVNTCLPELVGLFCGENAQPTHTKERSIYIPWLLLGCFRKIVGKPPKWMVKIMKNPMNKWMIWGFSHPYFLGWKRPLILYKSPRNQIWCSNPRSSMDGITYIYHTFIRHPCRYS